jgi:uncharacterized membrane protein YqjE
MTDGAEEPERPGLQDLPRLVRTLIERAIDLGTARVQLAQLELKEEVETRLRRAALAMVFLGLLLIAFGLLNVGLVSWLGESIGVTGAAFIFAAVYFLAGIGGLLWFRSTGGMNPPSKDEDEES